MFKRIEWFHWGFGYPFYHAHKQDAGYDLCLPAGYKYSEGPQLIDFGVVVKIPKGHCALLCPRSSFTNAGGELGLGVIDSGYTGNIKGYFKKIPAKFLPGERVAQLVFLKISGLDVKLVESLICPGENENSKLRGLKGFGSSGK